MPLRTIGTLLGATDQLKALSARARRLRELQTLYVGSAPRELASSSRVKNLRAGTLLISADNAAVASKLKQLGPTLLASIRKSEAEITAIKIEVQVSGALHEREPKSKKTLLSADAIQEFDALSKRVPDGKLKSALARMVRRHRKARSMK
jgi:hypothetical protein